MSRPTPSPAPRHDPRGPSGPSGPSVPVVPSAASSGLVLDRVSATYPGSPAVLREASLRLAPAALSGLRGPSGAGKSTLGRVAALLHRPDSGHVVLDGQVLTSCGYAAPAAVRRRVGLVFQSPRRACDPRWSLRRIITAPALAAAGPAWNTAARAAARQEAEQWAQRCGLSQDLLDRHPQEVSDGQLQRACLARVLALGPDYLICDEMTAMVDAVTSAALLHLVAERCEQGMGALLISHDQRLLDGWAERQFEVRDHQVHPVTPIRL